MRKHNGMRPVDVVIMMKIIAFGHNSWRQKDIAESLFISNSEVSESLHRSQLAGLIDDIKQNLFRKNLLDFLQYGVKYVFPVSPGGLTRGIPTAHSAPMLRGNFVGQMTFVWAEANGEVQGHEIEPLYSTIPRAVKIDSRFYEIMALIDMLRIGRAREIQLAVEQLAKHIIAESHDGWV